MRRFRLRNYLYCVEWGVKLYSLTHSLYETHVHIGSRCHGNTCSISTSARPPGAWQQSKTEADLYRSVHKSLWMRAQTDRVISIFGVTRWIFRFILTLHSLGGHFSFFAYVERSDAVLLSTSDQKKSKYSHSYVLVFYLLFFMCGCEYVSGSGQLHAFRKTGTLCYVVPQPVRTKFDLHNFDYSADSIGAFPL